MAPCLNHERDVMSYMNRVEFAPAAGIQELSFAEIGLVVGGNGKNSSGSASSGSSSGKSESGSTVEVKAGTGNVECCSFGPFSVDIFTVKIDGTKVVEAVGKSEQNRRPGRGG
jgi:hypothetical protein